ncbi:MAG: ComEC/Rec2 family competence protein [Firmicutes bacterium]|nr:ComEC/Rec2 family competence protein [Bacillota bacterium]
MNKTKEDKSSKKLFNVRPIVLWAFIVFLTVVFLNWAIIWAVVWLAALVVFFIVLQKIKPKNEFLNFLGTSQVFFVVSVILIVLVMISFTVTTLIYTNQPAFTGNGTLQGTVRSFNINENGEGSFLLTNASLNNENVRGRVRVNVRNLNTQSIENIRTGAVVSVFTNIRGTSPSNFAINNSIRYTATINARQVVFEQDARDVRSVVLRHVDGFISRHMSDDAGTLMYSMLFGDRSTLDDEIRDSFRLTGIAHILAVSGMHVGILVLVILWILGALKLNKRAQIILILFFLLFYMYLCDFRISIIRSSIMFFTFAFMRLFVRRIDLLTCICLAWIIVLVLFPYSLFSVSFKLSFGCMFGFALFYRPVADWLGKYLGQSRVSKVIVNSLSAYTVTSITTTPFLIYYFGFVSITGFFANVLLIPILLIAFKATFVAIITYVGWPLLHLVDPFIRVILGVTNWLAGARWGTIQLDAVGAWYLFYFVGLFVISRFIFMERRTKIIVASICFGVYVVSLIVVNLI